VSDQQDDFHGYDAQEEYAPRSILDTGWFRAVLVLTVLAVVVVVALPYLLNWFEPVVPPSTMPGRAQQTQSAPPTSAMTSEPAAGVTPRAVPESVPARKPSTERSVAQASAGSAAVRRTALTRKDGPALPGPDRTAHATDASRSAQASGAIRAPDLRAGKPWDPAMPRAGDAQADDSGAYWVQLGLFKDASNAERLARKVREQGTSARVARVTREGGGSDAGPEGTFYLVRAGGFPDRARAMLARADLNAKGQSGFITQGPAK